jgi:hypothetical protein
MAVTMKDNSIIMDTENDSIDGWWKIKKVRWMDPTAAGHLMELTDTAGNSFFKRICKTADQDIEESLHGLWKKGIKLSDLDSGTVQIDVY